MNITLAKLSCLVRAQAHAAVEKPQSIILLHGFGANQADLYPLADLLDPQGHFTWIFPDAPLALWPQGRAWFPITQEDLMSGPSQLWERKGGEALEKALSQVQELSLEVHALYGPGYIGGFSQGAMISSHVAQVCPFLGVILLSGALVDRKRLEEKRSHGTYTRLFQSHGLQDQILPVSSGKALFALMEQGLKETKWIEFSGGHEIPPMVITGLKQFLMAT